MSDLEFDVKPRVSMTITFRLGGDNALLGMVDGPAPAYPADYTGPRTPAVPVENRGRDSHEYTFHAPKNAVMLMPVLEADNDELSLGLTKSTFDWLGAGLSEEDRTRVINRLKDPKDDLDIETLTEVVQKLQERVSGGRPTT